MPFDEPDRVVDLPKAEQRLTELLDGVEGAHPEQVLLQGPDEALGAAVALGRPPKSGGGSHGEEGKLLLEGVGHVSRRSSAARPGGSARALRSGWPGARHECPRTRPSNDR